MSNPLGLISGTTYIVTHSFTDYDKTLHQVGEEWIFEKTNFVPYEDVLTLHVINNNIPTVYRLQWREEEQAHIIEHFTAFVQPVN